MKITITCAVCKKPKEMDKDSYNFQRKRGKKDFYHLECFKKQGYRLFNTHIRIAK